LNLLDSVYWLSGSFKSTLKWASLTANRTLTLPDKSGTIATLTPSTAVTVTAVTSIDYAISSGANRITFIASGVLVPGSLLRLSTGGVIQTTGYNSVTVYTGSSSGASGSTTTGLQVPYTSTTSTSSSMVLNKISGNSWTAYGSAQYSDSQATLSLGSVALSGELDLIRFMPLSGSFTAGGLVNIFVE
jgi:hypothetical protein